MAKNLNDHIHELGTTKNKTGVVGKSDNHVQGDKIIKEWEEFTMTALAGDSKLGQYRAEEECSESGNEE